MKDPALASSSRLGGAVISDRVVASLLEELTNGRYAQADEQIYHRGRPCHQLGGKPHRDYCYGNFRQGT